MHRFRLFAVLSFILGLSIPAVAQIPATCIPNQNQGSAGCSAACVRCDFDVIQGSTADNTLAPGLPPFCGTFDNPEWFRFVAGQPNVTFVLSTGFCSQNEGLEIAFYESCGGAPIDCYEGPYQSINATVTGLVPGREYLVVIDGYNGDLCDYLFHFTSPAMTAAPVPNSSGVTLQGSAAACPGGAFTYRLSTPVPGAAWYTWEGPAGSLINGLPTPVTLEAGAGTEVEVTFGQIGGQVRVTPKTACSQGATIVKQVSVQVIPLTNWPLLVVSFEDTPFFNQNTQEMVNSVVGTFIQIGILTSWRGCDSVVQQAVQVLPPVITKNVLVYWDANNNGVRDIGESPYPFGLVVSSSDGQFATTDTTGQAELSDLEPGDTLFAPTPPAGATVTPAFWIYQNHPNAYQYTFGIHPTPSGIDLSTVVEPIGPFRPGFNSSFRVKVLNPNQYAGTVDVSAYLPSWLDYLGATPTPNNIFGDTLRWQIALNGQDYVATVQCHVPVSTPLGTPVAITAVLSPVSGDYNPFNNKYTLNSIVVGSYDPNDKQVWPQYLLPNDFETPPALEYTIRFQNTGTFPAEFVRLIDTLQESLDPATFEFVNSSHPCTWKVYGNGILEFFFDNIFLPDSLSDPEGSIGSATFRIRPKGSLEFGDVLENFADIYFDFNAPIRTNTAETKAVYFIPGEGLAGPGMRLRPNPAAFHLRCAWTSPITQDGTLRLISMDGIPRLTETVPAGESTWLLDVQNLDPGMYVAVLEAGSTVYVKQVVVIRAAEVRGWK